MRWIKQDGPVTNAQAKYITAIEESLEILGVLFDGTTKSQASAFIDKYANYHKDMIRLERGQRPYWCMIANQPPRAPEIHEYFAEAYEYFTPRFHVEPGHPYYEW